MTQEVQASNEEYHGIGRNEWMQNVWNFAAAFEDEGILGLAQATVDQTTNLTLSIASVATSTAFHVLSEASDGVVGRLLMLTGKEDDAAAAALKYQELKRTYHHDTDNHHEDDNADFDHPDAPFMMQIAFTITDTMLGVITPLLVNTTNDQKQQNKNRQMIYPVCDAAATTAIMVQEKKHLLIKGTAVDDAENSSLSHFYDASEDDECCHEESSVYFDAASSCGDTISTTSGSASSCLSPTEENENECVDDEDFFDPPIPTNIAATTSRTDSPTYYLDLSAMEIEVDGSGRIQCQLLQNDTGDGKYYAITESMECNKSLQNVLDSLVEISYNIALRDALAWNPDNDTKKVLARIDTDNRSNIWDALPETEVLKWTSSLHGNEMLKTQGIVSMSAFNLKELLLDCSRVHLFNKNSLGKEDVCVLSSDEATETTKVVKNALRIPIVGGTIETISLIHSRCLEDDSDGFIIVSQSVSESIMTRPQNHVYSISILRPLPNNVAKTELTNIVQSSAMPIPKFLVRKVVSIGAIDFFSNLRALCK